MINHLSSSPESSAQRPSLPSMRRRRLLAHLASRRAELLAAVLELNRRALTQESFLDAWTVKDALAHIAAWDRWEHRQMRRMLREEPPSEVAVNAFNALAVTEWRHRSLGDVLAELQDARSSWVDWLTDLTDDAFFRNRPFDDWDWAFPNCLEIQWQHDAEHAAQIAAWREARAGESSAGPKEVLLAALSAARKELVASAALVPREERETRPVCGVWTLKDVAGHLVDWEKVGARGLRSMACGQPPAVPHIPDIERWNQQHAQAREDHAWGDVWHELRGTRVDLVEVVADTDQENLARSHVFPWGSEGTAYEWISVFIRHDREHAQLLREALGAELDA